MQENTAPARLDQTAVIDAACLIADRDGFHALSLTTLATDLDRHSSSLYNHVDGLDGLRQAVTIRSLDELGQRLWRAALGKSEIDGLRALAEAYRLFADERPGCFEAATSWQMSLERDEAALNLIQPATDAIHAVMRSFGLEDVAIAHATRVFTSAIVGFIRSAGRTFDGPIPREDTFAALIDLFALGLTETDWLRGSTWST